MPVPYNGGRIASQFGLPGQVALRQKWCYRKGHERRQRLGLIRRSARDGRARARVAIPTPPAKPRPQPGSWAWPSRSSRSGSANGWRAGGRGGWCRTVLLRGWRLGLPCGLDLPGTAALGARHLSAPLAPLAALRLSAHVEGVLRVLEETLAATSGALDGTCPVALLAGLLRHPSLLCQALRTTPKSGRNCSPSSRRPSLVRPPAYLVMLAPPDAAVNVERKRGRLRPSRELPCPPKARGYPPGGPRVSSHASMHVAQ